MFRMTGSDFTLLDDDGSASTRAVSLAFVATVFGKLESLHGAVAAEPDIFVIGKWVTALEKMEQEYCALVREAAFQTELQAEKDASYEA